jgi:hypothetical protein
MGLASAGHEWESRVILMDARQQGRRPLRLHNFKGCNSRRRLAFTVLIHCSSAVCLGAMGTRVIDREDFSMEPVASNRERVIARLWELASLPPEATAGTLDGQIDGCKLLHEMGYARAIQRLSEIAGTDKSRTGGLEIDQKAAERLLEEIVGSMEPDNSRIQ